MKYSFTFIDQYKKCPFRWYLKYGLKKEETVDEITPRNPLLLGELLHTAIRFGIKEAEKKYYSNFFIADNEHIEEVVKVQNRLDDILDLIPNNGKYEVKIETDDFIGRVDYVVKNKDGTVDIYDFKYTNNPAQYTSSWQLHLYKYYYEIAHQTEVRNLYYLIVPKIEVDTADVMKRRKIIKDKVKIEKPYLQKVKYDSNIIDDFYKLTYEIENLTSIKKNIGMNCQYCQYESYCRNNREIITI